MGFDALNAYLERLPDGLESYPECRAKASLGRAVLDLRPGQGVPPGTPDQIRNLVLNPPPPNAWISEVYLVAIHFFIQDADGMSDDDLLELTYQANKALTESRMYRALAKVASPAILLKGAAMSWGLIHKGLRLHIEAKKNSALIRLSHPPHLYPPAGHRSAALGFRAVIEAANGQEVQVGIRSSRPDGADFDARWAG
jgi:hypothetical protein